MRVLTLFFLLSLLIFSGCSSNDITEEEATPDEEVIENDVVLLVDGTSITEEEIEMYGREVAHDRAEENLSPEEIREAAIERAIRAAVLNNYFKERGITASQEEIEEELYFQILEQDGIETEKEYVDFMATRGIGQAELERRLATAVKVLKLSQLIEQDIEITDEEAREYHDHRREKLAEEGIELPSFEEMREEAIEHFFFVVAMEEMIRIFDEAREAAKVEILE